MHIIKMKCPRVLSAFYVSQTQIPVIKLIPCNAVSIEKSSEHFSQLKYNHYYDINQFKVWLFASFPGKGSLQ